ncbi:short stature homeobox protein 2-like [Olea europaea var. sylvestris]|uniref:short stature homeobox protein 2-like n=1 Tax=Olea europaea var. sylvestris TaxID=158386 RepID=UPI000C1D37EC|nr:short stature homeobox protein 2-like [Olea europaea var. sylvestris]
MKGYRVAPMEDDGGGGPDGRDGGGGDGGGGPDGRGGGGGDGGGGTDGGTDEVATEDVAPMGGANEVATEEGAPEGERTPIVIEGKRHVVDETELVVGKRLRVPSQYVVSSFTAEVKRRTFIEGTYPNLFREVDNVKWKAFETEWRRIIPKSFMFDAKPVGAKLGYCSCNCFYDGQISGDDCRGQIADCSEHDDIATVRKRRLQHICH